MGIQPARLVLVITLCVSGWLRAAAASDWVAELSSTNIDVRRVAVDKIQTLDDPRIPDACLPLLQDPGYSVRRQAARAIGSRYYQIPPERQPVFIAAMRKCRQDFPSGFDSWELAGDQNVADRGIGLLTRDFSSTAFSVSPDKKWVLYEQRRLPMIADTKLRSRQLLAPTIPLALPLSDYGLNPGHIDHGEIIEEDSQATHPTRLLKLMMTNWDVSDLFHPQWSPNGAGLVIQPSIQAKFFAPICIWRARDGGYRTFAVESFQQFYGKRFPHWGTVLEFVQWEGSKAILKIYDCDAGGGEPYDPKGIEVSVDIRDWKTGLEQK
jgi:hypothetical protein